MKRIWMLDGPEQHTFNSHGTTPQEIFLRDRHPLPCSCNCRSTRPGGSRRGSAHRRSGCSGRPGGWGSPPERRVRAEAIPIRTDSLGFSCTVKAANAHPDQTEVGHGVMGRAACAAIGTAQHSSLGRLSASRSMHLLAIDRFSGERLRHPSCAHAPHECPSARSGHVACLVLMPCTLHPPLPSPSQPRPGPGW